MRARSAVVAGAAVLALGAAGCGSSSSSSSSSTVASGGGQTKTINPNGPEVSPSGDIPDNQAYVAYSPPGGGYSVKVPEGWSRTDAGSGVTSFDDKLNRVQMQTTPAKAALTASEAHRTELPLLAKTVPGFKAGTISTVTRTAGKAVRITYQAQSPADAVTGKSHTDAVERYVFFHNGKDVVLTLSGPKGADNVDPWKIVTNSVRYTR
ncbi:MAG: lipoprotein [Solirubrobacterales bacterium]|nr:lipoprotein [Solirubrobacterales bacterium]